MNGSSGCSLGSRGRRYKLVSRRSRFFQYAGSDASGVLSRIKYLLVLFTAQPVGASTRLNLRIRHRRPTPFIGCRWRFGVGSKETRDSAELVTVIREGGLARSLTSMQVFPQGVLVPPSPGVSCGLGSVLTSEPLICRNLTAHCSALAGVCGVTADAKCPQRSPLSLSQGKHGRDLGRGFAMT